MKNQIIFGVMLFTLILTAELYVMINFPEMIIILAGMVIADLVCLYVVIDGIVAMQRQKLSRQEEQYDSIFKSQKASYIMLKKYFMELEEKLDDLEAMADIPREEIVNAQKGIAKVIINRGLENTQALMSSYEEVKDQIDQFQKEVENITEKMHQNYEEAIEVQRSTGNNTEEVKQDNIKDMLIALKDMELRLNGTMMQMQGNVMQAAISQQSENVDAIPTGKSKEEEPEVTESKEYMEDEEDFVADFEELAKEYEPQAAAALKSILEVEPDESEKYEELLEMESLMSSQPDAVMTPEAEMESAAEKMESAAAELTEESIPEPKPESEPEPDKMPEPESELKEEPSNKKEALKATSEMPELDLSDPNKSLSPDEIAALFANMGA